MSTRANGMVMAAGVAAGLAGSAWAGDLLVVNSGLDCVMRVSGVDGSVIQTVFIDLTVGPPASGTPKDAIVVGDEIWVSDQIEDSIWRYTNTATPTYIGAIDTGMDNIRGMAFLNGKVYVSNAETGDAPIIAPGEAVVMWNQDGSSAGFFAAPEDPFDILVMPNGNIWVCGIDDQTLNEYTPAGVLVAVRHDSNGTTGIDFPQQMVLTSRNTVLVAGFSPPTGIYEYDLNGTQLNYWSGASGPRGVYELENGKILWTASGGLFALDPATNTSEQLFSGSSCQYINPLDVTPDCPADFNGDGFVDFFDFDDFVTCFEGVACPPGQSADFNDDGFVDFFDYDDFIAAFEAGCP